MWELDHNEGWAPKNWCFWRLLRVPWTARKSNQSILKEINPEYSLEGLMLKLKLQYFGHLMWRVDSLKKSLMLGKTEGRRRSGQQDEMVGRHHWLNGHEFEQAPEDGKGQGSLVCCSLWGDKELVTASGLKNSNNNNNNKSQGLSLYLWSGANHTLLIELLGDFSKIMWAQYPTYQIHLSMLVPSSCIGKSRQGISLEINSSHKQNRTGWRMLY